MNTIGERIRTIRKRAGITQEALAEAIGKHPNLVARWERGEVKMKAEVIADIASVLGVSTSDILDNKIPYEQISKTTTNNIQNMSYWGEVVDNIRKLALHGEKSEISLIYTLLKSGCDMLVQATNSTQKNDDGSHVDIHQTNIGRDATVNLGTAHTEATA